jgi:hypothetical protein
MNPAITVAIAATYEETRLLATRGRRELLRARLAPAPHRWAAPLLLESLALWCQQPIRVVLYAESAALSSNLQLTDDLGFEQGTLFYEIELIDGETEGRTHGGFDELRHWCRGGRP